MLSLEQVLTAQQQLQPFLLPTPCVRLPWLDECCNGFAYGKVEILQRTGSFKFRGAMNALLGLQAETRAAGVVTASAGSHGLGVAEAARELHCPALIFVPETVTVLKREKLEHLGVRLIISGADYDDAEAQAREFARQNNLPFIHAFDDDAVICGQGTVGAELVQGLPDLGTVIIPVGGGGLLSGVSLIVKALRPQARVVGVQSEASPAMWAALRQGEVVDTPIGDTVADGLAGRLVTEKTLRYAQSFCDDLILVSEMSVRQAMREIFFRQGWRVEGSAAVGVAALLSGKIKSTGKDCAIILTGGNIAPETFAQQIS